MWSFDCWDGQDLFGCVAQGLSLRAMPCSVLSTLFLFPSTSPSIATSPPFVRDVECVARMNINNSSIASMCPRCFYLSASAMRVGPFLIRLPTPSSFFIPLLPVVVISPSVSNSSWSSSRLLFLFCVAVRFTLFSFPYDARSALQINSKMTSIPIMSIKLYFFSLLLKGLRFCLNKQVAKNKGGATE